MVVIPIFRRMSEQQELIVDIRLWYLLIYEILAVFIFDAFGQIRQ